MEKLKQVSGEIEQKKSLVLQKQTQRDNLNDDLEQLSYEIRQLEQEHIKLERGGVNNENI